MNSPNVRPLIERVATLGVVVALVAPLVVVHVSLERAVSSRAGDSAMRFTIIVTPTSTPITARTAARRSYMLAKANQAEAASDGAKPPGLRRAVPPQPTR